MMLAYIALQTLVAVPFYTLTTKMTQDYDQRTELTTYIMFFNLMASLVVAIAAPEIKNAALASGLSISQSYLLISDLFGGIWALSFLVMFFFVFQTIRTKLYNQRNCRNSLAKCSLSICNWFVHA